MATLVAVVVTAAGFIFTAGANRPHKPAGDQILGPGNVTVTLDVEHSRFLPARVTVRPHTTVRFKVVNHDPIAHELIVGGTEVHTRHESGNHANHGALPGEVSVGPGETAVTTYQFHAPDTVLFACHLPRHFEFGMVGEVSVTQ